MLSPQRVRRIDRKYIPRGFCNLLHYLTPSTCPQSNSSFLRSPAARRYRMSSTRLENERIRFGYLARPANVAEGRLVKPGQQPQVAEEH